MMVEVLSDRGLHISAAEGFLKTGIRAPFDKSGDVRICREAAVLRRAENLLQKVDDAVAEVRAECKAGRLKWSYNCIRRLISNYAKHASSDAVVANLGEDADQGEADSESDAECGEGDPQDGDEEQGWQEALQEDATAAVADRAFAVASEETTVDAEAAEQVAVASSLKGTLAEVESMLRKVGMEHLAMNCKYEQRKQEKRMR